MGDRLADRSGQLPAGRDGWNNRHNDWNDWHDRHYGHHNNWHHGSWHGNWQPGRYWGYWWDNYPVLTAFGVTTWANNRIGWAFGYRDYYNPYYGGTVVIENNVYDYSQPLIMTPDEETLAGDPNDVSAPPGVSEEALTAFDQARTEFFAGNYEDALESTDAALRELPNDAVIHEFRALVLFALGRYPDSAATLYAVLGVGPGWDWTTLCGLYPSVDVYTQQLRVLEAYRDGHTDDPAARFVLAYHYLTAGHDDAAVSQLKRLLEIMPEDQLATQLLLDLDPEAAIPNPPKKVEPPASASPVAKGNVIGSWTANRDNSQFAMTLSRDGTFAWSFTGNGDAQEVTGVWDVDEDGILVLEMNDEGVMLAQVVLNGSKLDFYMLGDTSGADPLQFAKQ